MEKLGWYALGLIAVILFVVLLPIMLINTIFTQILNLNKRFLELIMQNIE